MARLCMCNFRLRANDKYEPFQFSLCGKTRNYLSKKKNFREIDSLVKLLVSRNFWLSRKKWCFSFTHLWKNISWNQLLLKKNWFHEFFVKKVYDMRVNFRNFHYNCVTFLEIKLFHEKKKKSMFSVFT